MIVVPFALMATGFAWLRKSKPDIPIKIKPKIAAVFLAVASLYWAALIIFRIVVDIHDMTIFMNMIYIVAPVSFLALARYLLLPAGMPSETVVDESYEKPQTAEAPKSKIHFTFAIINIVVGVLFLVSNIIAMATAQSAAIGGSTFILIISLFVLITGFLYITKRNCADSVLKTVNIAAVIVSFILLLLLIIGVIIVLAYSN
jgi:hypothetical protein